VKSETLGIWSARYLLFGERKGAMIHPNLLLQKPLPKNVAHLVGWQPANLNTIVEWHYKMPGASMPLLWLWEGLGLLLPPLRNDGVLF
jgi:hypothetical protein